MNWLRNKLNSLLTSLGIAFVVFAVALVAVMVVEVWLKPTVQQYVVAHRRG